MVWWIHRRHGGDGLFEQNKLEEWWTYKSTPLVALISRKHKKSSNISIYKILHSLRFALHTRLAEWNRWTCGTKLKFFVHCNTPKTIFYDSNRPFNHWLFVLGALCDALFSCGSLSIQLFLSLFLLHSLWIFEYIQHAKLRCAFWIAECCPRARVYVCVCVLVIIA